MHHLVLLILVLLFAVMLLVILAQRLKVAYPIFLVISGLLISLIPEVPKFHIDPDLIFLIFLPPLLYEAAWNTSWNNFWKWRRSIAMLAFGLVIFTAAVVAYSSQYIFAGFTLAMGFLLGGIISPPDAVAATSVLKGMKVPKRVTTILEGESLVNDASSLIVFKFALAAILSGTFSLKLAVADFFLVAGMGILVGVLGGFLMYLLHRWLPTTPAIDTAFSLTTPYLLFLAAEHFHFSGVLAVVSGGLFISYHSHKIFERGNTRITLVTTWSTIIFILNAVVFILIGLELPAIMENLEGYSLAEAIKLGLWVSVIVIAIRFFWVFRDAYFPNKFLRFINRGPHLGHKDPIIISWAGMRGVVSLATALSIPAFLDDGTPFPQRSLIIFVTFVVIFVTLVFQGLSLPWVIKKLNIEDDATEVSPEDEQLGIRLHLNHTALDYIKQHYASRLNENEFLARYVSELENSIKLKTEQLTHKIPGEQEKQLGNEFKEILLQVFTRQREELFQLRKEQKFSDEGLKKIEMQLDINELNLTGMEH